ncbi:MAG: dihydroxyacetone kinase subunit DhaL [Spirochaetales bacterium]
MKLQEWKKAMQNCATQVAENQDLLCKLDSYVGDGDHGRTVARGFIAVSEYLKDAQENTVSDMTAVIAHILGKELGGAIGPIFQSIFSGFSAGSVGCEELTTQVLGDMFKKGLEEVKFIGEAKVGDKTLVDSLEPASISLQESAMQGLDVFEALKKASSAAKEGCEGTVDLVAKKGRAKFLGEKSKGYQDAGATTMYIIINAISQSLTE